MSTSSDILLGYGGGAKINGVNVLITSGSLTCTTSLPIVQSYHSPIDKINVFSLQLGAGTVVFGGSINFDFTTQSVFGLINQDLLCRNSEFDVSISDGRKSYKLTKCKWSSFSVSASPNSMVSGSISFVSCGTRSDFENGSGKGSYIFDDELLSYWYTGNTEVESFSLNLSQSITPVFLNTSGQNASYLRCGVLEASLQVSSWDTWLGHKSIKIGSRSVSFGKSYLESQEFNYGGQTTTGTHSYSIKVIASSSANEVGVLSIG